MSALSGVAATCSPLRKDTINVVVVGDAQVGKSSLVSTFVSEAFPDKVAPVLKPLVIPAELTPDHTAISIVDTSSELESRPATVRQLLQADVVMLVCAHGTDHTVFDRVKSYWFQLFEDIALPAPVVLVMNKSDLIGINPAAYANLISDLRVEAYIEVSAKRLSYVSSAFHLAQHTALYPLRPLYDVQSRYLKAPFVRALARVFRILDQDNDHVLSNTELNTFQTTCFGFPHSDAQLEGVKKIVARQSPTAIESNGVTFEGFLYLIRTVIEKRKADIAWSLLVKFGYTLDFELRPDYYSTPASVKQRGVDQTCEFTDAGLTFLTAIFRKYDRDQDGALAFGVTPLSQRHGEFRDPLAEMQEAFLPCAIPLFPPDVAHRVPTNANGDIELNGWLSYWSYAMLTDPENTCEALVHMGYGHVNSDGGDSSADVSRAVRLNRGKRAESGSNTTQRRVLNVLVFGAKGVGKTSLLRSLITQGAYSAASSTQSNGLPTSNPSQHPANGVCAFVAVRNDDKALESCRSQNRSQFGVLPTSLIPLDTAPTVLAPFGLPSGCFMAMREIPEDSKLVTATLSDDGEIQKTDLVVLVYDGAIADPLSFDYVDKIVSRLPDHIPVVVLRSKVDLPANDSLRYNPADPARFMIKYKLLQWDAKLSAPAAPMAGRDSDHQQQQQLTATLIRRLAYAALVPGVTRPETPHRKRRSKLWTAGSLVAGASVLSVAAFFVLRHAVQSGGDADRPAAATPSPASAP